MMDGSDRVTFDDVEVRLVLSREVALNLGLV